MARAALWTPAHRILHRSKSYPGHAQNAAPSQDFMGSGIQDHRLPWNTANSSAGAQTVGFYGSTGGVVTVDQAPATSNSVNIASYTSVTQNVPMRLTAVPGNGITVVPEGGQLWFPFLNTIPAGAVVFDGMQQLVRFGSRDFTAFYDPSTAITRAIAIGGLMNSPGGSFLLNGFDYYGQLQTQTVVLGTSDVEDTVAISTKTFKGLISIIPQFTDGGPYCVGTADAFGLGLAVDVFPYIQIYWDNVLQPSDGFIPADNNPPTNLTGDVRGVCIPPSGANGNIKLVTTIIPSLARAANNTLWGLTPLNKPQSWKGINTMADALTTQLYDGEHNVVFNMQDLSDGTGLALLKIIDVTTLKPNPRTRLVLWRVNYDVVGGQVVVYWEATVNTPLLIMKDALHSRKFNKYGGLKNNAGAGATGNVLISTSGFGANSSFSLTPEFKKGGQLSGVNAG